MPAPTIPAPTAHDDRRCRRTTTCTWHELVRNPDGEATGERRGALLEHPGAVWCDGCRGRLSIALDELPGIFAGYTLARPPSASTRYDATKTSGGGHLDHSPVPLELRWDAAHRYVEHEAGVWADVVADTVGLVEAGEWNGDPSLREACQLLGYRMDQWLPLPAIEYRARSIGDEPWRGHNPDTTTRDGRDWWCTRDAATAAAELVDLHRGLVRARAEYLTSTHRGEWTNHTCVRPACGSREVFYERSRSLYRCRSCGGTATEDTQLGAFAQLTAAAPAETVAA